MSEADARLRSTIRAAAPPTQVAEDPAAAAWAVRSELTLVGAPPDIASRWGSNESGDREEKLVITAAMPALAREQYRKLAAILHHAQMNREVKVVMVASALSSEGKTLTATNLALTFSESYRRQVLLIDADLRRPTIHDVFGLPDPQGLNDYLWSAPESEVPVYRIRPQLSLLPGGRPNPDPLSGLTSNRMRQIVSTATNRFDWVLIDTPPVSLMPDANLLASMADAVVFVIAAGKTPYPVLQRAVEAVGRDRIVGVVLNRAEEGKVLGTNGYYGYYNYYSAYGDHR